MGRMEMALELALVLVSGLELVLGQIMMGMRRRKKRSKMKMKRRKKKRTRKRKKGMEMRVPDLRMILRSLRIWIASLGLGGGLLILMLRRRTRMMMGLVVSCGMILGLVKLVSMFWMAVYVHPTKMGQSCWEKKQKYYCCTIYIMINGFHVASLYIWILTDMLQFIDNMFAYYVQLVDRTTTA
jgi:hypothetical protein